MYNNIVKQFIFRQSSGKLWNIFCDENRGLCYSNLSRINNWLEPTVIQRDVNPPFYACMDEKDIIHVIYQDNKGTINYTSINDGGKISFPVLSSKLPSAYNKHMFVLTRSDYLHAFFVLNHKDSYLLAHQLINNKSVSTPKVIDYIADIESPYTVAQDSEGNIYTFYQASDGKYTQLVYKKYISGQNFWGDFTPLTRHNGNCGYAHAICDSKDILHICYQRQNDRRYELVYQQKVSNKNIWSPETVIHNSAYKFSNSGITSINDEIIVFWVRDEAIYFCSTKNNGTTWSRPARYNFPGIRNISCISYKSNSSFEKEKVITSFLPGNLSNGFKLAFYHDIIKSENIEISAGFKKLTDEDIGLIKNSLDELKGSERLANEKSMKISQAQENLERELIKYSVKMGMIETDLNQLKSTVQRNFDFDQNDFMNSLNAKFDEFEDRISILSIRLDDILEEITELKIHNKDCSKEKEHIESVKVNLNDDEDEN